MSLTPPFLPLWLGATQGGGVGPPYSLPAVRAGLDYGLKYVAGLIANSPRGVIWSWCRANGGSIAFPLTVNNTNSNGKYLIGQHTPGAPTAEADPGANFVNDNAAGNLGGGVRRLNLSPPADTTHPMNGATAGVPMRSTWQGALWVWDTNFSAGNKRLAFAVNGVNTGATLTGDTNGASNVGYNGADWWINANIPGWVVPFIADWAQTTVWFPPDVSALMTGNGVFAPGAINRFITPAGGPIDFGADGSGPFSFPAAIYHKGDKSTYGFNAGTDQALGQPVVVGQAQRAFPYDYMFGPGQVPDRPYEIGTIYDDGSGPGGPWPAEATGGPYNGILNNGVPTDLGDRVLIFVKFSNNLASSGSSRNIVVGGGFSKVGDIFISGATGGDFAVWQKIATASEVNAGGSDWVGPPITWTPRGVPFSGATWTLSVWKGVGSLALAIQQFVGSIANGMQCPSTVAAAGKTTLLAGFAPWAMANEGNPGPPPTGNLLWWPNTVGSFTAFAWEPVNVAGATAVKRWSMTVTGNNSAAFQLALGS